MNAGPLAEEIGIRGERSGGLFALAEAWPEGNHRGDRGGRIHLECGGDDLRERGDLAEVPALALGAALDGGEVLTDPGEEETVALARTKAEVVAAGRRAKMSCSGRGSGDRSPATVTAGRPISPWNATVRARSSAPPAAGPTPPRARR